MSDGLREALTEHLARRYWEHGMGGRWERPADAPDAPFPAYADDAEKAMCRAYVGNLLDGFDFPAASPVRGIAEGGGITDEAVQAAAEAWTPFWSHRPEPRAAILKQARRALEAALPLLGLQQVPTAEQVAMKLSLVRFSDEESDRMIELTMREAWPLADAVVSMFSEPAEDGS